MRLATYNVEWFNALFADDGSLLCDDAWSARWGITRERQIAAIGAVFQALDADAVMVIEAPDTSRGRDGTRALETFARAFNLRARAALIGFANDTQQEIALLYDPDLIEVCHDPGGLPMGAIGARDDPRFDDVFHIDLDTDSAPEHVRWSKPPLEVILDSARHTLRLIGVHAKSKAPHGATSAKDATRIAIENRRKQLAQCIWLRHRVEGHLAAGDPLIVMGDFNDGPGLDEYERLFGRSGVEIVRGEGRGVQLYDPHVDMPGATSARFWHQTEERWFETLLDFILVSPDLAARGPQWRIWHPLRDPLLCGQTQLCQALLDASDHFPVTLDLPDGP
ncbi:endonuclease/exonuclease/phosphatase family protein [Oceaniglobus ichthyenteri]|uniref:endonuclease/exonuclease/phosphatase family protein n=1 Tax=Oceaniglobus ichthyenteri TaxID=2136177 RepID=UPI000D3C01AF|nr:endonuclease/exonuclease/phosphatase family protein [Oceaniglobus ichthyenteri]